jgi:methyl-branched lipid omega-hydroxylase
MTDLDTARPDIATAEFWQRPLAERMADFAVIRDAERFPQYEFDNMLTGEKERFFAAVHFDDIIEMSKNPKLFCSGQGATTIPNMPIEALEYFGGFINMDDPRHARQRGIVARSFTPRRLAQVIDSVESICDEVIDDMCEKGEVDLVATISAPFPLLVICDMMGIPRSEFQTVLDATNIILGGGDPEFMGDGDPLMTLFGAGQTLTQLMAELAEERRRNPTDDLTSALVQADSENDMLAPEELGSFFILLAVAGNDTTRTATSLGMDLLAKNPDQRKIWTDDLDGVTPTAVEEIVRMASPVTYMRRTVTEATTVAGHDFEADDKVVLFYGAGNRDPKIFPDPETFDVRRTPNNHVGFGGPGPHFCLGAHLARRELAIMFNHLFTRLPDIETAGEPTYLEAQGAPLVGGVKRLPVRFTPQPRSTAS